MKQMILSSCLFLLLQTPSYAQQMTTTITLNATADNSLFSYFFGNFGTVKYLISGSSTFTWRILVQFDGLSSSATDSALPDLVEYELTDAVLVLAGRNSSSSAPIACNDDGGGDSGCGTVHLVTSSWAEGTAPGCGTENASSWGYRDYPLEWSTRGGDFLAEPVLGRQRINTNTASVRTEFSLNTTMIEPLIRSNSPSENNGFLVWYSGLEQLGRDNHYSFDSRECANRPPDINCQKLDGQCCRWGIPPQLDLKFRKRSSSGCTADLQECFDHRDCCSFACVRSSSANRVCAPVRDSKNRLKEKYFGNGALDRRNRGNR